MGTILLSYPWRLQISTKQTSVKWFKNVMCQVPCTNYLIYCPLVLFPFFLLVSVHFLDGINWSKRWVLLNRYKELPLAFLAPCRPMQATLLIQVSLLHLYDTIHFNRRKIAHVHIIEIVCRLSGKVNTLLITFQQSSLPTSI